MNIYGALAYEYKDRPGVYIGDGKMETTNVEHAFLYIAEDGNTPDIEECKELAKVKEEEHEEILTSKYGKATIINFKPYQWLEFCNLVEVEISEDTFKKILRDI